MSTARRIALVALHIDEVGMSVKQERMPAGTAETLHYYEQVAKFFFILNGEAVFTIENIFYRAKTLYQQSWKRSAEIFTDLNIINTK